MWYTYNLFELISKMLNLTVPILAVKSASKKGNMCVAERIFQIQMQLDELILIS